MKALAHDVIVNSAVNAKNGTFVRIGYRTELPVKASFKKQGIQFFKYTETSVRLGVSYGHIASVIARKAEQEVVESVQRANNYEWVVRNKVRHNTSTGKDYLYVASANSGAHAHTLYVGLKDGKVFSIVPGEVEDVFRLLNKEYMIPSYWDRKGSAPEVMNISFENIYKFGSEGDSLMDIAQEYIEAYEPNCIYAC